MASIISASTTSGTALNMSADTTGVLQLATGATPTTAITIDASQRAAFVAGTAAAPAITTTGDTNTGIFFPAADTIAFAEGGVEAMRLDSSGKVGINTSSLSERLSVNGGIAATGQFVPSNGATVLGYIGNDNSISGGTGTNLGIRSDTATTFATGGATERMRIDSGGAVLMGKTTTDDTNVGFAYRTAGYISVVRSAGAPCYFNRTGTDGAVVQIANDSVEVGTISVSGSSTAYNTSSDYRLKENIVPMTGALDTVSALKPVTYTWKIDGSSGQGFIAHELQAIVPDCVSGEKDAVETYIDEEGNEQTRIKPQGVDTSFLVATLTAAIQEQQTIINDLKARVTALEAK